MHRLGISWLPNVQTDAGKINGMPLDIEYHVEAVMLLSVTCVLTPNCGGKSLGLRYPRQMIPLHPKYTSTLHSTLHQMANDVWRPTYHPDHI